MVRLESFASPSDIAEYRIVRAEDFASDEDIKQYRSVRCSNIMSRNERRQLLKELGKKGFDVSKAIGEARIFEWNLYDQARKVLRIRELFVDYFNGVLDVRIGQDKEVLEDLTDQNILAPPMLPVWARLDDPTNDYYTQSDRASARLPRGTHEISWRALLAEQRAEQNAVGNL